MDLGFWLRKPQLIWPRLQYWAWQTLNPGAPWFSAGAVAYCDGVLAKSMRVLEFGSGRSTLWLGKRVGHLTSVEHSNAWFDRVGVELARDGLRNVEQLLVPLDHPESEPECDHYEMLPAYVDVVHSLPNDSLDMVIVDGHYRTTCILQCPPKLKPGGLLLVDDIDWWGGLDGVPVPSGWKLVHHSAGGIKSTGIWRKPQPGSFQAYQQSSDLSVRQGQS